MNRTEQDKINRKEANQRYYQLEENKQQKRDYMKTYVKRDYVIAKRRKRPVASNEDLHAENTHRFINYKGI